MRYVYSQDRTCVIVCIMRVNCSLRLIIRCKNRERWGNQRFCRFGCVARIFEMWGLWTGSGVWKWGPKTSIFGGLRAKIWAKTEVVEAKIFHFLLKRGTCELRVPQMGPLWTMGEVWKLSLQSRTSPYPLSRSVPPPPGAKKDIYMQNFPLR